MNLAAPQGKRSRWVPDVRRAAELGVQMRVALPAALDRTLRWHTADA
jgi:hypothetical protein